MKNQQTANHNAYHTSPKPERAPPNDLDAHNQTLEATIAELKTHNLILRSYNQSTLGTLGDFINALGRAHQCLNKIESIIHDYETKETKGVTND